MAIAITKILNRNVRNALAAAESLTLDELQQLLDAERDNKNRKGAVEGLEQLVAQRLTEVNVANEASKADKAAETQATPGAADADLAAKSEVVLDKERMTASSGPAAKGHMGQSRTDFVRVRGFMFNR